MRLAYAAYLDVIAEEGDRLEELFGRGLNKSVPSCPKWRLRELVLHVAGVYQFWTAQVRAADPTRQSDPPGAPREPTALAPLADLLFMALEEAGPTSPCWNWSGEELTTSWVARRMALESAVHRVDGEQSLGGFLPIDTELALDGIEERIALHLATALAEGPGVSLGGSLCLICSDAPAAFVVEVERGRLRWRHGRAPADVALVGSASQLFLFTWNRVAVEALSVTGDRAVAEAWRELPS